MAQVTLTVGSLAKGRQYATLQDAWAAVPPDLVSIATSYIILMYNDGLYEFGTTEVILYERVTNALYNVKIMAATGNAFFDSPTFGTDPLVLNSAKGVTIHGGVDYANMLTCLASFTQFYGLQLNYESYGNSGSALRFLNTVGCSVDRCIVRTSADGQYVSGISSEGATVTVTNTLVILDSNVTQGVTLSDGGVAENVTVVRPSKWARPEKGNSGAFKLSTSQCSVINCLSINTEFFQNTDQVMGVVKNNATDGTFGLASANSLENISAASVLVNPLSNFRIKAGSPTINAGVSPTNSSLSSLNGSRQMGTSTDIGAEEFPEAIQAPSATILTTPVNGRSVTITGSVTGAPTSGTIALVPSAGAYNDTAVKQGPVPLTFSNNTFSVTFDNVPVGQYGIDAKVGNSAYPSVDVSNASAFPVNIVEAKVLTLVQDPMDGQVVHLHGTYSGTVTGATFVVPASKTDAQGALDTVGTVTYANGVFTADADLLPGNYEAGILRFKTAGGTSAPQPGTGPVAVIGIYGSAQAIAGTPDTVAPTLPAGITFSAITTTGFKAAWSAANDDTGVMRYEYSIDGGTTWVSVGSSTNVTVTAAGATTYTFKVRAVDYSSNVSTAIQDTVTTLTPVVTTPTVTAVTISPNTVTLTGPTQQFTAAAQGTNSPAQTFTYSASAGTISATGLLTAPAAATVAQTLTVTATSKVDPTKSATATVTIPAATSTGGGTGGGGNTGGGTTPTTSLRTVTLTLVNENGPAINHTNIKLAVFDEPTPDLRNAPKFKTSSGMTDANGVLVIQFTSTLAPGGLCGVSVQLADGHNFDVSAPVV